jgi:hypothetical protein
MPLGALRVVLVAALSVIMLTPSVHAQTGAVWTDFAPRLLPPTDNLMTRADFEVRAPDSGPIPTSLSLGRVLEGESSVSLGVTRLRPEMGLTRRPLTVDVGAATPYRNIDVDLQQTSVSFDLKFRWPSRDSSGGSLVESYLLFGPGVFVAERNPFGNPLGFQADTSVRLGVKAEAGITWRLDGNTSFFSEYRFIRGGDTAILSSGGRFGPGPGSSPSGYDLLSGLRLSF